MHNERSITPPSPAPLLFQTCWASPETSDLFTIKISELLTENLVTKFLPYQHYSCPMHLRGHPDRSHLFLYRSLRCSFRSKIIYGFHRLPEKPMTPPEHARSFPLTPPIFQLCSILIYIEKNIFFQFHLSRQASEKKPLRLLKVEAERGLSALASLNCPERATI